MNHQTPFILVSADRAELSEDINAGRRDTFEHQLHARGLDFKRVAGVYKGTREVSYVVLNPDTNAEALVLRLARRYGQESVLLVDSNRYATLAYLYPDAGGPDIKRLKGVGFWRAAEPAEALALDAYTQDGEAFYVTAPAA